MKMMDLSLDVVSRANEAEGDAWVHGIKLQKSEVLKSSDLIKKLPDWVRDLGKEIINHRKIELKSEAFFGFDVDSGGRHTVFGFNESLSQFDRLTLARKLMPSACIEPKMQRIVLDLTGCEEETVEWADALVASIAAALYEFPKYKTEKVSKSDKGQRSITIVCAKSSQKKVSDAAKTALTETIAGTNLVRWLAKRAGNDLTCKAYIQYVKDLAKERKWRFEHWGHDALVQKKAGAFLAVVQGSDHKDYGIVKLTYKPKSAKKHLALVGKGLTYDTGGHSLKPSQYMFGMHGDMAGSALALALLNVATLEQWPYAFSVYLAVADNMIGPKSYKPNDVIKTAQGTTIEVIDTDAEGRMVLSDTLHFASQEKPDLLMDFATLTGSCVRAIGTTYSGVFTNQQNFQTSLIQAGAESGERVWPFPMDKDFANCLESTSADTKQCREKGGVDHIEASQFLMKFVADGVPWVHVDLSAMENQGGLAHVPTDETGFGVRFASRFIRKVL